MAGRDLAPTCPRRSRKLSEVTIKKNKSSLEVLIQMGFPKPRAEKALAATGDTGVQLASDWLLSHVNDPTLDEHAPREYILYLCPVGQLQQELIDFWHKSFQECGWNRAHNYFPHVTLCSFFTAEDSQVPLMAHMLKSVVDRFKKLPDTIGLEYFSSTNFIGLFISEISSLFVKQLTADFSEEGKKIGVTVEPHKKQLHISLAYQFPTDKKDILEGLAKTINPHLPVRWDIRLYSREAKLASCQVRKVLYTHNPTDADELELVDGDFIFVENSEIDQSTDSWYHGSSWLTGQAGMFPGPFTERCAESEVWTMHRAIPTIGVEPINKADSNGVLEEEEQDNTPKPPEIPPRSASMTTCHVASKQSRPPAKSPTRPPNSGPANNSPSPSQTQSQGQGDTTQKKQAQAQTVMPSSERPRQQSQIVMPSSEKPRQQSQTVMTSSERPRQQSQTVITSNERPRPQSQTVMPSTERPRQQPPLPQMHPIQPQPPSQQEVQPVYAKVNKTIKASHPPTAILTPTPAVSTAVQPPTAKISDKQSSNSSNQNTPASSSASVSTSSPSVTTNAFDGLDSELFAKKTPVVDGTVTISQNSQKVGTLRGAAPHQGPRQLYVVRHGERIDFTFGKEWIKNSFDKHGHYVRYDLNMPKKMPKRKGGPPDFAKDSPLTIQGHFQAKLIGEAMKDKNITMSHIYASPSLRCIETASTILKGLGLDLPIHIEPGLFEWLGWYQSGVPNFMSLDEVEVAGFKINRKHEVVWPFTKYNVQETTEQYYERCHHVTKEILKRHDNEGGNVIVVAHAASLDVCTRQLVGQPARSQVGFHDLIHKIPYCAMSVAQEACLVRDTWYLIEPPVLPFAHTNNPKYNWTCLTSPSMI